jgi:hypothetical protein
MISSRPAENSAIRSIAIGVILREYISENTNTEMSENINAQAVPTSVLSPYIFVFILFVAAPKTPAKPSPIEVQNTAIPKENTKFSAKRDIAERTVIDIP